MIKKQELRREFTARAIDVFAGAGGLTQGLRRSGFSVVGALEINENASKTFSLNHPTTKLFTKDANKTKPRDILRELEVAVGELDLLAGCPPCQSFSSLPTKNGHKKIESKSDDLILRFGTIALSMRPKVVLMENVPGVRDDPRFVVLCGRLERAGYSICYEVINMANLGLPQRRRRLVLIASRIGEIQITTKTNRRRSVFDAIGKLPAPELSSDPLHNHKRNLTGPVLERILKTPVNGGSRTDLPDNFLLKCHQQTSGFKDVYGRMSWENVSPTITSGCINPSKGRFIHPEQNRPVTLRECALLQSFPPSYKFDLSSGMYAAALQIGNALPPLVGCIQGENIIGRLKAVKMEIDSRQSS